MGVDHAEFWLTKGDKWKAIVPNDSYIEIHIVHTVQQSTEKHLPAF